MLKQLIRLPLLLLLLCSSNMYAQDNAITISSFTVKAKLPANIDEWRSTAGVAVLVAKNNKWGDRPCKLLVAVKKGEAKVCGNPDGITLDYFSTRSFQTNDLLQGLNNCETLLPGDYTLCVSFRGLGDAGQWTDISTEVCKPFTVGGGNADGQKYTAPRIVTPEDGKIFTEKEMLQPLKVIWTPVVPAVKNVTYILKIWEKQTGQTSRQAMLAGAPIIEEKILNRTQYIYTGSGLLERMSPYDSTKKPLAAPTGGTTPHRDFVITVQAVDQVGKGIGENNGTSEPSVFMTTWIPGHQPRICTACENIQWQTGNPILSLQGNNINLQQSFSPSGYGNIFKVKAEITSFERYTGDSCISCTKDYNQWGNFVSGTYSGIAGAWGVAVPPVTGSTHHSMYWNTSNTGSFNLNISTPTLSNLSCCCDRVVFTIRYTFTFKTENDICITCSQVKTYTLQKGNCRPIPVLHDDFIDDPK